MGLKLGENFAILFIRTRVTEDASVVRVLRACFSRKALYTEIFRAS